MVIRNNLKCADCTAHCGYEATAVKDATANLKKHVYLRTFSNAIKCKYYSNESGSLVVSFVWASSICFWVKPSHICRLVPIKFVSFKFDS